ncbi:MAG: hypothetical protein UX80_C0001G0004 [Candidatus Amesbacteria bacterium GW2011_GWA2_47_11b]|uniref:YcfA family protein n=3 Tax=Candidatus Amesiibacteriota TaxID=1752730 RepID=A0A0G1SK70_9BACT|nr:MAG: hypothetical protein UX42_C0026G0005 [Microgenomates group bacterium GW2011_GWC1_46_20]KKU58565.1 MAG: hypothetical protein UX80_C0001G0004 [Candidatus Amesbacteria bacterium GW2011_GWA2_47_11b]KKU69837.1 MAG: hypothetical protein UX92_C0008G0005 [Candidatus Amesbacteria bacterium GW2011_GWA1_47_20]KKU84657.1 MAG: hypothetical protein UY11_C0005G0031 [Candidatus Amesbacteria bacterium GW2011_GWC2_47_8]
MSYRDVVKKAKKAGFAYRRTTGSHEVWWNFRNGLTCVIPRHFDISPGTLRGIIKQIGLSEKEFRDL